MTEKHVFIELENGICIPQDMMEDNSELRKELLGIPMDIPKEIDHPSIDRDDKNKDKKVEKTELPYCIRYRENNKPIAMGLFPDGKLVIDTNHDIRTCNYWLKKSDAEAVFNICSQDKEFKEHYYIDILTGGELCEAIGFNEPEYLTKALEEFKRLGVIK